MISQLIQLEFCPLSGLRHVNICEVSSLARTLCNQLSCQVERLLKKDFLKTENYLIS